MKKMNTPLTHVHPAGKHVLCLMCGSHVRCEEQIHSLKRVLGSLHRQVDTCFEMYLSISHEANLCPRVRHDLQKLLSDVVTTDSRVHVFWCADTAQKRSQFEHLLHISRILSSIGDERKGDHPTVWCGFFDDDDFCHPNRTFIMNQELLSSRLGRFPKDHVLYFSDSMVCAHIPSDVPIDVDWNTDRCTDRPFGGKTWRNEEHVSFLIDLGCFVVLMRSIDIPEKIGRPGFDRTFVRRVLPLAREIAGDYVYLKYRTPWMYLYIFDDVRSAPQVTAWIRKACQDDYSPSHCVK